MYMVTAYRRSRGSGQRRPTARTLPQCRRRIVVHVGYVDIFPRSFIGVPSGTASIRCEGRRTCSGASLMRYPVGKGIAVNFALVRAFVSPRYRRTNCSGAINEMARPFHRVLNLEVSACTARTASSRSPESWPRVSVISRVRSASLLALLMLSAIRSVASFCSRAVWLTRSNS